MIFDFFNRDIIGLSLVWHKTADLVKKAIQSIPYALTKVKLFHSDSGKEFDNALIDEMLEAFGITRSLSQAGCPYDNAVAERPIAPSNWSLSTKKTSGLWKN
ncbi:Mobile element protein [Streptococcus acidominimus]|uniref:Mobile element protein n=1 Tax=Streptococcus acidominimus TaxID=1326 RepID=A0A239XFS5_STRAI|nr:Mobile element protein [Streptococcus acidominimus]